MLTRGSKARAGSPSCRETSKPCSVEISAKDSRQDASSVLPSESPRSRQAGSSTKRAVASGRISTSPRGAGRVAKPAPSRVKAQAETQPASGNACVFVLA